MAGDFSRDVRDLIDARADGRCERHGAVTDQVQYHHRRPRGMGGSRLPGTGQAANGLRLCFHCHDVVEGRVPGEGSRQESKDQGWLIAHPLEPTLIWVQMWDGKFILHNDGTRVESSEPYQYFQLGSDFTRGGDGRKI